MDVNVNAKIFERAKLRFVQLNPGILSRVLDEVKDEAKVLGVDIKELTDCRLYEAMKKSAENLGMSIESFVINLGADSPQEADFVRSHNAEREAEILGISNDVPST